MVKAMKTIVRAEEGYQNFGNIWYFRSFWPFIIFRRSDEGIISNDAERNRRRWLKRAMRPNVECNLLGFTISRDDGEEASNRREPNNDGGGGDSFRLRIVDSFAF